MAARDITSTARADILCQEVNLDTLKARPGPDCRTGKKKIDPVTLGLQGPAGSEGPVGPKGADGAVGPAGTRGPCRIEGFRRRRWTRGTRGACRIEGRRRRCWTRGTSWANRRECYLRLQLHASASG